MFSLAFPPIMFYRVIPYMRYIHTSLQTCKRYFYGIFFRPITGDLLVSSPLLYAWGFNTTLTHPDAATTHGSSCRTVAPRRRRQWLRAMRRIVGKQRNSRPVTLQTRVLHPTAAATLLLNNVGRVVPHFGKLPHSVLLCVVHIVIHCRQPSSQVRLLFVTLLELLTELLSGRRRTHSFKF